MRVNSFCIYNFRSVENSDWIDYSKTTTLVEINGSGKQTFYGQIRYGPFKHRETLMEDVVKQCVYMKSLTEKEKELVIKCFDDFRIF